MLVQKIRYRLVYNRKNHLNAQGTALVQIEALLNRRRVYFSTNVYLRPEHWCKQGAQVVNHPQAHDINTLLWQNLIELQALELSYYKRSISSPLSRMKEDVAKGVKPVVSFSKYMDTAVEKGERKESTRENLRTTVKILREYRRIIEFADINVTFIRDFEQYLLSRGLKVNTVHKHMRHLRTMVNEAIRDGYIPRENYAFDAVKLKKERTEHRTLTPQEMQRVEQLKTDEKKPMQRRVLDAFLFCCYTGLRFSDFRELRSRHIIYKEGAPWLVMKSKKTGTRLNIPLYLLFKGKALKILSRYRSIEQLADIGANEHTNSLLKRLIAPLNIDRRITFHSARHTCATLLIYQGVPITTVQAILGHSSVRTTEIYADVLKETIVRDLTRANNKRHKNISLFLPEDTPAEPLG